MFQVLFFLAKRSSQQKVKAGGPVNLPEGGVPNTILWTHLGSKEHHFPRAVILDKT